VSDTEERPAAEPEEIGDPESESAGQVLASASVESGGESSPAHGDMTAAAVTPAEAAGQDDAVAAAGPAAGPDDAVGAAGPASAGPDGRRRRTAVLGWTAALIAIIGVAWLLTTLITYWTTYAALTVPQWQMLTYGPHSARIAFFVHNSGNGAASGCTAHVQLGNGQILSATSPPIQPGTTQQYYLVYRERRSPQTRPAYAWDTCGGARTPNEPIATVADVSLLASHVQITRGAAVTTIHFAVRNAGSREASSCHAFMRFSGRKPVGAGGTPADLRGGASATFSVAYASSLGHPVVIWAECYDPPASDGLVYSTRAYLRSLFRSS
jgi:hypothetical protein